MVRAAKNNESIVLQLKEEGYKLIDVPTWFKWTNGLWLERKEEIRKLEKKRKKNRKVKVRVKDSEPKSTVSKVQVKIVPYEDKETLIIPLRKVSHTPIIYHDEPYPNPMNSYDYVLEQAYLSLQQPKTDPNIELMKDPDLIQTLHELDISEQQLLNQLMSKI